MSEHTHEQDARLRDQVRELLDDVERLEKGEDPPSVSRSARRLRRNFIEAWTAERERAERAEERLRAVLGAAGEVVREWDERGDGKVRKAAGDRLRAVLSEQESDPDV